MWAMFLTIYISIGLPFAMYNIFIAKMLGLFDIGLVTIKKDLEDAGVRMEIKESTLDMLVMIFSSLILTIFWPYYMWKFNK